MHKHKVNEKTSFISRLWKSCKVVLLKDGPAVNSHRKALERIRKLQQTFNLSKRDIDFIGENIEIIRKVFGEDELKHRIENTILQPDTYYAFYVSYPNTTSEKLYFVKNGKYHREDGPAVYIRSLSRIYLEYFYNGVLHHEVLPACFSYTVAGAFKSKVLFPAYYLNGLKYEEHDFTVVNHFNEIVKSNPALLTRMPLTRIAEFKEVL